MTKANWIAGAAIVFVVLALALTLDPLGFFDEPPDEDSHTSYVGDDLGAPGLSGGGKQPLPDQDPKVWEGDPVGVLFLQLGKATLKGSVIAGSGPLRFARVRPVLAPPNEGVAVRTRKDGTFEIRGLPDGAHELRASMASYVSRTVTAPPVLAEQTVSVPPIELDLRRARTDAISVRVTDLFGRPLPGAKVLATTLMWDLHLAIGPELNGMSGVLHDSGRTDENGRVRLGSTENAANVSGVGDTEKVMAHVRAFLTHELPRAAERVVDVRTWKEAEDWPQGMRQVNLVSPTRQIVGHGLFLGNVPIHLTLFGG